MRRTRKWCRAPHCAITRSRTPSFHTRRQLFPLLWTCASRRQGRAWLARVGSRVRAWLRGCLGGMRLSPSESGQATPPPSCPHRLPAGQGDGGAAAMRVSCPRPPSVARRQRRVRRAWTSRPWVPVGSLVWPLDPAAWAGGAWGRTPPRRRAGAPGGAESQPGPRRGGAARARARGSPAWLGAGLGRPSALAPPGGWRFGERRAGRAVDLPASAGGRAGTPDTGGRSGVTPRGAPPPSALGTRPQRVGPGPATRRGSHWGHPGTPWGWTAGQGTVNWPCVVPPGIRDTVDHKSRKTEKLRKNGLDGGACAHTMGDYLGVSLQNTLFFRMIRHLMHFGSERRLLLTVKNLLIAPGGSPSSTRCQPRRRPALQRGAGEGVAVGLARTMPMAGLERPVHR